MKNIYEFVFFKMQLLFTKMLSFTTDKIITTIM